MSTLREQGVKYIEYLIDKYEELSLDSIDSSIIDELNEMNNIINQSRIDVQDVIKDIENISKKMNNIYNNDYYG